MAEEAIINRPKILRGLGDYVDYAEKARAELEAEPNYQFEELPTVCAEWRHVLETVTYELTNLKGPKGILESYREEKWVEAGKLGVTKDKDLADNKENREALFERWLNNDEGYIGILRKRDFLQFLVIKATVQYKRYSREFEVQRLRREEDLIRQRHLIAAELLSILPNPSQGGTF